MGKRLLLALGWLWPFVVAAAGVAAIAAGQSLRSDGEVMLLFLAALLGSPAVVASIAGWLPSAWSSELRGGLAVVLAVPVLAVELSGAVPARRRGYPTSDKGDKAAYGYGGRLTVLHPDMALVLVYFPPGAVEGTPQNIAYMPRGQIRSRVRGGFRCVPSSLRAGVVTPRQDFLAYFDAQGLAAMGQVAWA